MKIREQIVKKIIDIFRWNAITYTCVCGSQDLDIITRSIKKIDYYKFTCKHCWRVFYESRRMLKKSTIKKLIK